MPEGTKGVVTPERLAQGLTYEQWLEAIDRNQERFRENYERTALSEEDLRAFRELAARPDGPAHCLALAEAWCPDTFRGLPVMARIAEAAGMELRIFFRDANKDIMAEFLDQGEFESIPTFVFYTREHRYIAQWAERPTIANEQIGELRKIFEGRPREEAMPEFLRFHNGPIWANWRRESVREIQELLAQHYR